MNNIQIVTKDFWKNKYQIHSELFYQPQNEYSGRRIILLFEKSKIVQNKLLRFK